MPRLSGEVLSGREAWPLSAGTIWIYEGTAKWTEIGGRIRSKHFRWTNEVEWAASSPLRQVAVVRGSLSHLGLDEPDATSPPTVFVAEGNRVYEIAAADAAAIWQVVQALLDREDPLPDRAMEVLNLPLTAGKDFAADAATAPRDDHWYRWNVEKATSQPLRVPGLGSGENRAVATLAYRTNPDHQVVEFAPGVGVLSYVYVHHGTVGEVEVKLKSFRDGRVRDGSAVGVADAVLFGDMECLRIETPAATFFYGKRGAGFASIVDPEGHDWISYRPGGKALGEYRGLPKCGQPVKYFHCGYGFGPYTNDNPFTTRVERVGRDHVRVHSETRDGAAACVWDFFPAHATLTLLRIPGRYWFLYEGTPGGRLDPAGDFVIRPGGRRSALIEPWLDDVSWMLFGAKESPFGLLCVAHQPSAPASYVPWPYKPEADGSLHQMTVAGFGRPGWQDPQQHTPPLDRLPARFTIAVTPRSDAESAAALLRSLERAAHLQP